MATSSSFGTTEYPVDLLHAEIVRYFREREEARGQLKNQWIEQIKTADGCEALMKDKTLANQILCHRNAESRLEEIGYRVGYVMCERVSKDAPRLTSELEMMKFICKEFWISVFGKQVDNLRTNHQGIYVIQDNKFSTVSSFSDGTQYLEESIIFLAMPSGIVRGALSNLGLPALVTASSEKLPCVKFNVHLQKASGTAPASAV